MIARALSSHRQGAAWIMRRRSQGVTAAEAALAAAQRRIEELEKWLPHLRTSTSS